MRATFCLDLNKDDVGTNMVNTLQRLSIETNAYADNIAFLLSNNTSADVVESASLKAYQKKQVDTKIAYEAAKKEMEKLYIPKYLYDKHRYNWNLDFSSGILTVTVYDNAGIRLLKEHGVHVTEYSD